MNISRYVTWSPHQGQRRALVKALCYRLFMVVITVSVAWTITGSTTDALTIGAITNVAKTGTYYVYERAWDRVTWGLNPH